MKKPAANKTTKRQTKRKTEPSYVIVKTKSKNVRKEKAPPKNRKYSGKPPKSAQRQTASKNVKGLNREDHVRKVLRPLADIASKHKIAVVIVIHMNKDNKKKATQRILGSGAFVGTNRSTLFVAAPDGSDRRLLIIAKNNNLSPENRRKAVEFTMEDVRGRPRISWGIDYEEDVNLDAILSGRGGARVSKLDQAAFLIREHLAEGDRPMREFEELAKKHGIHMNTFKTAKDRLGVQSVKHGGGAWFWSLAEGNNINERPSIKRERLEQEDKGTTGQSRIARERL